MRNRLFVLSIFLVLLVSMLVPYKKSAAEEFVGHVEKNVVKVYDKEDNYIFGTAMQVIEGDRYISHDDIEYVIKSVDGKRATAEKVGKIDLLDGIKTVTNIPPMAAQGKKLIGIYHTHNGESYRPGPVNINGNGEVFSVGKILKKALEKKGIRVIHSAHLHLPQDAAAYERSRVTALKIAKQRPDAIFDVHRDAIPNKSEYLATVSGEKISQIRIVVGRQNPNMKVNDKFARQIKAISKKLHPGLIKDIFYGHGGYNQQIGPRTLLFEFGTHVTSEKEAEESAAMLSDSINQLLYGGKNNQPMNSVKKGENRSALHNILWMVGILVVGLFIFLFINEGSWEGVINRIKKFFGREIID